MNPSRVRTLTSLLLLALVASPLSAQAEKGFWKLDQISNVAVQKAAKFVYAVETPAGEQVEVDLQRYPTLEKALETFQDHSQLTYGEAILRRRILTRCFRAHQSKCAVFETSEVGSLFLFGDTQTAISAFHVFRDGLRGKADTILDLVISDRDGKVLFGATEDEVARVSFMRPEEFSKQKVLFDFVQLKLPRPIDGQVLEFAEADLPLAANAFHVGYPGKTYDRIAKLGKPDSDGTSQYVTYGPTVSAETYFRTTGKDPDQIQPEVMNLLKHAHVHTDADSYFGMSGGPTFNDEGKIVGITTGVFPVEGTAAKDSIVLSLRAGWIKWLLNTP